MLVVAIRRFRNGTISEVGEIPLYSMARESGVLPLNNLPAFIEFITIFQHN